MNKTKCSMPFLAGFFLLIGCVSNGNVHNGENRYVDKSFGFSIVCPEFWQATDVAGLESKLLFGPQDDNFYPNINFIIEKGINLELRQYVDANITGLPNAFPTFRLIRRNNFRTENNVAGEKILYTITSNGILIRMAQYIIPGRNGVYMIITCGSPGSAGDKYDALYDRTVGTFIWDR